jgi:ribokinase
MSVAIIDAEGDYGAAIVSGANAMIDTVQFDAPDIWRALSHELVELVDIVVVNAVEAEDMGGLPVDDLKSAEHAAIALTKMVETAIVTAGGEGVASALRGQASGKLAALPVEVVSTHGAGDMFIGSLCHQITQHNDLEAAIEVANIAAAKHIS